jgi:hypothetical protein
MPNLVVSDIHELTWSLHKFWPRLATWSRAPLYRLPSIWLQRWVISILFDWACRISLLFFYLDIFLHSNFDCMKIVSSNTSRAGSLKAICTGTERLRKVKPCVDGIAYLQIKFIVWSKLHCLQANPFDVISVRCECFGDFYILKITNFRVYETKNEA